MRPSGPQSLGGSAAVPAAPAAGAPARLPPPRSRDRFARPGSSLTRTPWTAGPLEARLIGAKRQDESRRRHKRRPRLTRRRHGTCTRPPVAAPGPGAWIGLHAPLRPGGAPLGVLLLGRGCADGHGRAPAAWSSRRERRWVPRSGCRRSRRCASRQASTPMSVARSGSSHPWGACQPPRSDRAAHLAGYPDRCPPCDTEPCQRWGGAPSAQQTRSAVDSARRREIVGHRGSRHPRRARVLGAVSWRMKEPPA